VRKNRQSIDNPFLLYFSIPNEGGLSWRPLSFSGPLAGRLPGRGLPPGFDSSISPGFAAAPVVTPLRGGPLHSLNRRVARSHVPQVKVAAADVRRGCPYGEFNGADSSCESRRHRKNRCQRNCFEFHGRFLSRYVPQQMAKRPLYSIPTRSQRRVFSLFSNRRNYAVALYLKQKQQK
jgi:hypothetical protein